MAGVAIRERCFLASTPIKYAISGSYATPANPDEFSGLEVAPDSPEAHFGVKRMAGQPSEKAVPRGSLFHVRYAGKRAVAFVDGNTLALRVFCREQGGALDRSIRYGLAITIEAGEAVQVYKEVRQGLGIRPRP